MKIRYKNLLKVFTIFLVLLISCGFASAVSDLDEGNSANIVDNGDLSLSDNMMSDSANNCKNLETIEESHTFSEKSTVKDVSYGLSTPIDGNTFEDIQIAIDDAQDGDTIQLNGTYLGNGSPIIFSKNLTIGGSGETILDANGLSGIINSSSEKIVLKDLTFVNGSGFTVDLRENNGDNLKYCSIINCSFEKCYGDKNSAVICLNGSGIILDCDFHYTNCTINIMGSEDVSILNSSFNYTGGYAIHSNSSTIVKACDFYFNSFFETYYENTNKVYNGNIVDLCKNSSISDCMFKGTYYETIIDSLVDSNTYQFSTLHVCDEVDVINCTFIRSITEFSGSAIYHFGNGSIINCTFINNSAGGSHGTPSYLYTQDGVVYIGSDDCLVLNCTFINCHSNTFGGALYINARNCYVINSTFIKNSAYEGGAIYLAQGDCYVINPVFSNNKANHSLYNDINDLNAVSYENDTSDDNQTEKIINPSIELDYLDDNLIIIFKDIEGKAISGESVSLIINNKTISVITDSNGEAKVPLNETSMVKAFYVDANGLNVSSSMMIKIVEKTNYIPIKRNSSFIDCKNMTTSAITNSKIRDGEYFVVSLKDANGKPLSNKPIQIGFNGKAYDRTTNENGSARLQINLAYVGTYTFAVCFLGDDYYNGSFVVAKIDVNAQKASLNAPSKTYKASTKTKALTATLKDAKGRLVSGKSISFTINGKSYVAKTNTNGVATVKVSLSKKGTYNFTAKLDNDKTFKTTASSGKLVIK
ncbi:adhesin-like protein [Methanobrevibacter ruminantium M1]|uniref:Adhesin-like protein n=1 Tax=Methanobrevibacter ruminantium (strain ATCC 35063 / DSM 1093 / JCM 13430 / OCM 146 / M1) TaxID=634498 RepID=D3E317_METRM|nr:Ig-like domain-containing protein [Methanobrevibacter ruminantium]ADC46928.1 adhesin-like protein [Methanobrevibacter ruminantium M1]